MSKLRYFLLGMMLMSGWAQAMNAVIWQPQARDAQLGEAQWQALMVKLHQQGFDTLVLQWTRYGEAFNDVQQQQALFKRALAARGAGLKLIVGLNSDPEFFTRQRQPQASLERYLTRLGNQDVFQADGWLKGIGAEAIDGWYMSAEIDDLNWRSPEMRAALTHWLTQTRQRLQRRGGKPVYISSFFAGNMAPQSYQALMADISTTGVRVWVQDGAGVAKLSPAQRALYLDASVSCETAGAAQGIVYELFSVLPGKTFRAQPMPDSAIRQQLARTPPCGKDRVFFSLRYLPLAHGTLRHD